MDFDGYKEAVKSDSKQYIAENIDAYFDEEDGSASDFSEVYDDLFIADSVTGNGSGSYTCNSYAAMQNVSEVIWDSEFWNSFDMMGYDASSIVDAFKTGAENIDVLARIFALSDVYGDIEEDYMSMVEDKREEFDEEAQLTAILDGISDDPEGDYAYGDDIREYF